MGLWATFVEWFKREESQTHPLHSHSSWRLIKLRRNAPPPTYNNTLPKDFEFWGRVLLHVESVWKNQETKGTPLDGEIVNRLAIYERRDGGFVSEQCRYNPRVIFVPPEVLEPIPMLSMAQECASFDDAVSWIFDGSMITDGKLKGFFEDELRRHESGEPPGCPPHGDYL